jgi:Ni,Fe-hydrogenase maturation factor
MRSPDFARTHGLNLIGTIMLGQLLYPEEMPEKLVILGVEAWDVDSFKGELSPRVEQAIPEIIGAIKLELGD